MSRIRSSLEQLFVKYESGFTKPSFKNFTAMAKGWILCSGRHSISRVILFMPEGWGNSHSPFYRFFSRAQWAAVMNQMDKKSVLVRWQVDIPLPNFRKLTNARSKERMRNSAEG